MATDNRLDQVSQLTDFDYALIVKGNQVAKVSKQQLAELVGNLLYGATNVSSLASVVAGVMKNNKLFPFQYLGNASSDFNNNSNLGFYRLAGNYTNSPQSYLYGILICIKDETSYITQICIDTSGNKMWIRGGVYTTQTYTEWSSIV